MQVCLDVIIKAGCVINIAQGVQLLRVRLKKLDKGGGVGALACAESHKTVQKAWNEHSKKELTRKN